MRQPRSLEERFWEKVAKSEGCWVWTAANDGRGYGVIQRGRRGEGVEKAHRIAWQLTKGPIPTGMELDHLCRNRACVRPDHLEPVTHTENMRRGESGWAKRTHCVNGHAFSPDNTRIQVTRRWSFRVCLHCQKDRMDRFCARRAV